MLKADLQLQPLPPIPAKRYFTIGEVSELCGVKPHVLRYWEQEFTQLKPVKRRGNRRYYQHHEVLLIRRIRELLYEQGFTISGARNRLDTRLDARSEARREAEMSIPATVDGVGSWGGGAGVALEEPADHGATHLLSDHAELAAVRAELIAIAALLRP